jgi:hypothetical protein
MEREGESVKEGERERERDVEYVFQLSKIVILILKGMMGALAPFSYLVK